MFQVAEINSPAELAEFRPEWDDLLRRTPGATFFQSHQWLETYWQFFGPEHTQECEIGPGGKPSRLRVLTVHGDGQLVGILPLAVTREKFRLGTVRVLGYPLAGWGSFYGPIGPQPVATLSAGLHHIYNSPRDWDLLDLRWVDAEIDAAATPLALTKSGFRFHTAVWHLSAQIELHDGWAAYWDSRKPRWRSNVRRSERLLAKHGPVEYVRYRPFGKAHNDADPRWDLYNACLEIAGRSWQGSSTTGTTMTHNTVREFLRAAHAAGVQAGAVDMNLLLLAGRPVAFAYNYHFGGSVYGLRSGYDPNGVHEGAGNVLMAKMIEDSCRRGDRLIDLGPEYLDCKRRWLTRLQPAYHYTHFHPARLRAQAMRLKRIVKRWMGATSGPVASLPSEFEEKFEVRSSKFE